MFNIFDKELKKLSKAGIIELRDDAISQVDYYEVKLLENPKRHNKYQPLIAFWKRKVMKYNDLLL